MRSMTHLVHARTAVAPTGRVGRPARRVAGLLVAALAATGLVVTSPAAPATADTKPEAGSPATVAADGLPTVQIDGVAWSQVVVGGTVYVAGKFTTARPAGAAAGVSTTARANLLAYDLATGNLVTTWAPKLNGPAYAITASPDGTKLYVGGDFTSVDGVGAQRFVALDRATGKRITTFAASNPNAAVKAITATSSTVYLGGSFNTVAGKARNRAAAVNATTGALTAWVASADLPVEALTMTPDNSRVIVGGRFTKINGAQARGSASVSASTGAVQSWAANKLITNYGWDSGITSLSTDGTLIYGSGFAYLGTTPGSYGNLEGAFAADPTTGAIKWIEDCHGDTYSVYPNRGKDHVYVVGHPHFCGNIGGFGETGWRSALAFTKAAVSTITPNKDPKYFNFGGQPAPRLLHFFPDLKVGAATDAKQAAWHVTGSGDYLVLAGEFLAVNGKAQQGLVRMASSAISPDKVGPVLTGTALTPAVTSEASGTAQVSWPTNWDRDNATLTYQVFRNGATTPVYTVKGVSHLTERPRMSFTNTGLTAGQTYRYKVAAVDDFGNKVTSSEVSVVVAGTTKGALSTYAKEVLLDNPEGYWRLGETSGAAQDWTGFADLSVGTGATRAVAGAIAGDGNKAIKMNGASSSRLYGGKVSSGLNRFSVEAWVRTSSTTGGKIVGYGTSATATSSATYDRHLYIGTDGKVTFGVNPNSKRAVTAPTAVNDGKWHHVVGTLSPSGMKLYVDGALRAERTDTIAGEISKGYWRIGGDAVSGWPAAGAQDFVGDIDEVAVYGRALTATEIAQHRSLGVSGTAAAAPADAPADAPAATTAEAPAQTAPAEPPTTPAATVATDAFGRTVAAGWGSADVGGPWTTTAGVASVSGGAGLLTLGAKGASAGARLPGATGTTLTTQATARWDARPAGGGGWWLVRGRITPDGEYRLKVGVRATGAVTARLVRTNAAGSETTLGTEVTVPGLTVAAGTGVVAELEVVGTSPTTLRGRVWAAGQSRPAAVLLTASDATAGLQVAGHTGLAALVSGTTTNVPLTVRVDDYTVVRAG